MDKEIYEKLKEEFPIEEEISFNEFNIQEKLRNWGYIYVKYKELYEKEKNNLDKIQDILDEIIGERYNHYRFEIPEKLTPKEIETYYLPRDEKIAKVKKIYRKQENRVAFFKMCAQAAEKQQWTMKSFLDSLKMQ